MPEFVDPESVGVAASARADGAPRMTLVELVRVARACVYTRAAADGGIAVGQARCHDLALVRHVGHALGACCLAAESVPCKGAIEWLVGHSGAAAGRLVAVVAEQPGEHINSPMY